MCLCSLMEENSDAEVKTNKQCSLRFHLASPASPPASSAFPAPPPSHPPVFPYRLTQHPQSLLARLVPRGQRGMVDDAGDVGVVVAAAHLQGELAAHRVRGIVWNGLHHVWASWREEWARRNDMTVNRRAYSGTKTTLYTKCKPGTEKTLPVL